MYRKKSLPQHALVLSLALFIICGGCTNTAKPPQSQTQSSQKANMLVADQPIFTNLQVYKENNGLVWVPLEEAAKSVNYDLHYENGSFSMGNTDVAYSLKVNQTQALAGDKIVELPQALRLINNKPYITTQSLSSLFGTPVNWNAKNSQVVITPIDDLSNNLKAASLQQQMQSLSTTTINKNNLLSFAEKFMGTPYDFAAGPYDRTGTFDCSSFVQYVYAHFGLHLPRSSRSQAGVGQHISMNQLQPGDLMFFYTPGRFSSNRIVGHVGMYMGNGKIIQTYGHPGVVISDFSSYWKHRFLFGRRVA
jgi:cell wall-associated NlpC family hydrolase